MTHQKKLGFMRSSKFRHIFGQPYKREQCYDGIKVSKSSWESTFCSVNPKFVAIITDAAGGGAFIVLPINKTGRVDRAAPLVCGHKSSVLDIKWSPFNDNMIASGSEDCSIKIWEIPEEGLTESLTVPWLELNYHTRRVGVLVWHTTASNILCSGGADGMVLMWNLDSGEMIKEISFPDIVLSLSFNYNGTRLAGTCKDKKLRIMDPRSGEILQEGVAHKGAKGSQTIYVKNGQVLTLGSDRTSERQYALWDENDLSKQLCSEDIDNSNGVMFPFYDYDNSILYLCGKGDSNIRFYEITNEAPYVYYLSTYQSNTSMRGFGYMHKKGLNVNSNEIARIYKVLNTGFCEVIPFTVPRKSELFQDDLYPDTAGDIPALTADEWVDGKDAEPILISLKGGYTAPDKGKVKIAKRANILTKRQDKQVEGVENAKPAAPTPESNSAAVSLPPHDKEQESATNSSNSLPEGFDAQALMDDTRKLKLIVKAHERRIKTLEEKIEMYELDGTSEEEEVADA